MKKFAAKLLLLGEHTVLHGSSALALPLPLYGGQWAWGAPGGAQWQNWLHYLEQLVAQPEFTPQLDLAAFAADAAAGLYFASDIPVGYGAGSSGALVAAWFARYSDWSAPASPDPSELIALKAHLGLLESFFHGSSSGVDPLICLLNRPVYLPAGGSPVPWAAAHWPGPDEEYAFFLLDSGQPRQTGPLVAWFREQATRPDFAAALRDYWPARVEAAIAAFAEQHWTLLYTLWQDISRQQWEQWRPLIPAVAAPWWTQGLEQGDYALKLCGAGGGGFLLGMARRGASLPGPGQWLTVPPDAPQP